MNILTSNDMYAALSRILDDETFFTSMDDAARSAKLKLLGATLHDATCARVRDYMRAAEIQDDRYRYKEADHYAILALSLLRRAVAIEKQLVELSAKQQRQYVLALSECPKPHCEPKTWWQRVCLKLGGF